MRAGADVDDVEPAPVALAPHEALVIRRDELAMVQRKRPVGRVDEQGVVDRAALELVHADGEPDAGVARSGADARPPGPGARPTPGRAEPRAARPRCRARARVPSGSTGTRARTSPGTARAWRRPRSLASELGELVDRRVAVEHDRLGLDARDADGSFMRRSLRGASSPARKRRPASSAQTRPARLPRPLPTRRRPRRRAPPLRARARRSRCRSPRRAELA